MKKWNYGIIVFAWLAVGCTAQQMRKIEQSMSCQLVSMSPVYEAKNSCGFPYAFTSFVKNVRYGKEMKMADGAPAPLLILSLSAMPDGAMPSIHNHTIALDLKGGTSTDRRNLYCSSSAGKPVGNDEIFHYGCEFEDGQIRKGEYMITEVAIASDRCKEPTYYKAAYEQGSEMLCDGYVAPPGYPLLRFTDSVRMTPIDQRKIESAWNG